jgi:4-hydroxy-4-methyl-2-oxoglutarate aldolase
MADLDPRWKGVPAALVYDAAGSTGDVSPEIRLFTPGIPLLGRAFTVKCVLGDWLAAANALEEAQPNDVLVIDVGDTDRAGGWGGTASAYAKRRGIGGVVTNGSVRDLDEIRELQFPVYAGACALRGAKRVNDGWRQIPISLGGVVVNPGDIVVGDVDGLVVVSAHKEEQVLTRLEQLKSREDRKHGEMAAAPSYIELTRP